MKLGLKKTLLVFFIIQIKLSFEPFLLGLWKNLMSVVIGVLPHSLLRTGTHTHAHTLYRPGFKWSWEHKERSGPELSSWSPWLLLSTLPRRKWRSTACVSHCEGLSEVPAHGPCPCSQAPWCQPRAACSRARMLIMVTLLRGLKALWK